VTTTVLHPIQKLTIHCPIRPDTHAALAAGDLAALEADDLAAPVLAAVRKTGLFGAIGPYRDVFHVGIGLEGFTPTTGARPTVGEVDLPCRIPTAAISVHASAATPPKQLAAALAAIAAAHPWELPVMEVSPISRFSP